MENVFRGRTLQQQQTETTTRDKNPQGETKNNEYKGFGLLFYNRLRKEHPHSVFGAGYKMYAPGASSTSLDAPLDCSLLFNFYIKKHYYEYHIIGSTIR